MPFDSSNATGPRPILNNLGGVVARPGVFGSEAGAHYAVTVASVSGSNKYHFDGVDRPNPTLIRGATYTFDQSDSSNGTGGTHPLRFATAADAAGSSQYTDGVVTDLEHLDKQVHIPKLQFHIMLQTPYIIIVQTMVEWEVLLSKLLMRPRQTNMHGSVF